MIHGTMTVMAYRLSATGRDQCQKPSTSGVYLTSCMGPVADCSCRFAQEIVTFVQSGPYINLSPIDPAILYIRKAGYSSGSTFFTDSAETLFMCLTSGRCVTSHLTDVQPAPTARGSQQNFWKYIDVSPHTVEFERLCAVVGMATRQSYVETNLIRGNALCFTTRSGKARECTSFSAYVLSRIIDIK